MSGFLLSFFFIRFKNALIVNHFFIFIIALLNLILLFYYILHHEWILLIWLFFTNYFFLAFTLLPIKELWIFKLIFFFIWLNTLYFWCFYWVQSIEIFFRFILLIYLIIRILIFVIVLDLRILFFKCIFFNNRYFIPLSLWFFLQDIIFLI